MTPPGIAGRKYVLLAYFLIAALCFLAYSNVLQGEFVWDDIAFYVDNPSFTDDDNIGRFFLTSLWNHSSLHIPSVTYRPFTLVVMWINQTLFGTNVTAHHLFNIALHIASALLLFKLLLNLLPGSGLLPSLAGAGIFAVHPVHVEAVAWISAYSHVMATALLLGAFLSYLHYIERTTWKWLALSLILFTLALLTHETAVVFPLVVTAYEYLSFRKINVKRVAGFWAVVALYFVVRKLVLGEAAPVAITDYSAWGNIFGFSLAYIETLFFPWPQFPYMAVPIEGVAAPTGGILAVLLIAGMGFAVCLRVPKKPVLLFGIAWIVLALSAPILAALNTTPLFAFRSLYLPSVGISILIAWLIAVALRKQRSIVLAVIALLILVSLPTTLMLNRDWLSNATVYEKMLIVTPTALGPATALATIYEKRGDEAAAERILLQAAEHAAPNDPLRVDVHEHLGLINGKRGDIAQSEAHYRVVVGQAPRRSSAWVGLGNNAWARGDIQAALDAYLTAINADPKNYEAVYNTALAYRQWGDLSRANEYFQRALTLQQSN